MELTAGRRLRLPRSAPFAAAAMLVWGSVLVGSTIDWTLYAIATALLLLAGVPRLVLSHRRRLREVASSLVFLAAVAVLRASAGGANSGVAVVALITVFYVALYGEDRLQLCIVIAGVVAFYLIPIVLIGPPQYPHAQYRAALLTVSVAAIIGIATRRLVEEVRHQAQEAGDRERMLEQVNEVVRTLSCSSRAREEVCEAAKTIGEASVSALFEPVRAGSSTLRATATGGLEIGYTEISDRHSAISETFASGQPCLITEDIERHLGSRAMWEAAGRPTSVLYEPLMRGAEPVGVLAVGWSANVRAEGSRATVVALLAHEAAAVIDRADTLSELSDMASTDPLTGLPNRRAWDAHISKALAAGRQFIVAMLDLDHFKEFNDTYGHPAGDRLLKETAAIWRQQLRSGDLVARLGGEEFGLLLIECDAARANDVIERLRGLVHYEQTCSVGFAHRRAGESADVVMARADAALYEAKTSGRDRVCISV
ncbi:MAG TPA: sensor domain-containing diguanylate cyclase [Solirubrobacteraceae bacterium]|jgi:diguanylate cyclase (GGDEF)-like protein